jgi:hypothetical protein
MFGTPPRMKTLFQEGSYLIREDSFSEESLMNWRSPPAMKKYFQESMFQNASHSFRSKPPQSKYAELLSEESPEQL